MKYIYYLEGELIVKARKDHEYFEDLDSAKAELKRLLSKGEKTAIREIKYKESTYDGVTTYFPEEIEWEGDCE